MNFRSVRARLTLWYFCALALAALVIGVGSRWAMESSLNHAMDQGLRHRIIGLDHFIQENRGHGEDDLAEELRELQPLGDLFQVFGPNGALIARSEGLARHEVSTAPPPDPGAGILYRTAGPDYFPLRVATQRVFVDGKPMIIEVADPMPKFQSVIQVFYSILYPTVPFVLAIAALGGYWLSGRAMAPVDKIIEEARAISPANLAARLSVPQSGDELQRLSETLNDMLARVEQTLLRMRQFTADASHELRAPLTLIYTASQFALRKERSQDELIEALQKILREAERSTVLVNELLWLARADSGELALQLSPVDIGGLAEEIALEIKPLAAAKKIELTTQGPVQPTLIHADRPAFRRLLVILLDNAVKYTQHGGTVAFAVTRDGNDAVIRVSDNGPGIATEDLPHVFDRFWRADKVRSRQEGGTGLGLNIAMEIAQSHHAQLTVESTRGSGATFQVRIPVITS